MRAFARSLTTIIASLGITTGTLGIVFTPVVQAHEGHDHGNNKQVQAANTESPNEVTYSYTAQAGDSYTKIARKAVQTYGLKHKVSLSQAKIVYAETNLTQEAGSPLLNEGQEISIKESTVKAWVDNAGKLTGDQEAAWQQYVQFVDFNTDHVGETRQ